MAEYLIQGSTLTAIADAIRIKGRIYDNMSPTQIPSMITTHLMSVGVLDALISNPTASAAKTLEPFNMVSSPSPYTGMYLIQDTTLRSICNALRTQGNFSGSIKISEIPQCIDEKLLSQDDINAFYNKTLTYIYNTTATTIGAQAFQNCTQLSYVEFTKATTVGSSAFQGCTVLNYLSMPKATTVNTNAFSNCKSVQHLTIGLETIYHNDAVGVMTCDNKNLLTISIPNCKSFYSSVCRSCHSLTQVTAPLLTDLYGSAFYKCSSLKEINLPQCGNGNTWGVGTNAFADCTSLSKVTLPLITSMNPSAFANCTALKEFYAPKLVGNSSTPFTNVKSFEKVTVGYATVPNLWSKQTNLIYFSDSNATAIGSAAFQGCDALKLENCTFGTKTNCTLTNIHSSAFMSCPQIVSLSTTHFPQATPKIVVGISAFASCTNLSEVNCDSFVSVMQQAFAGCTSLTKATFLNASHLGRSVFQGCTNLSYLSAPNVTSLYTDSSWFPIAGCNNITFVNLNRLSIVPAGLFRTRTALQSVIINNATAIYSSAFSGCTNLSNVQINNVTALASDNIFIDCKKLNENGIQAANLQYINSANQGAFRNTGFVSIHPSTFPNLLSIGYNAFQSCTSLTSVHLSTKTTYLGRSAFANCPSLTYISAPGVTSVYTASSWVPTAGCANLEFVNFNGLTTVPYALLNGRTYLSTVYINGATTINQSAFKLCPALKSVYMNAATVLNAYAFADCPSLTYISAPSLQSITTNYVFANTGFTNVNSTLFPALKSISHYCFSGCANLSSVNLPNVTYLGRAAFGNCPKLTYVSVPKVTSIYVSGAYTPLENNTGLTFANFNALATIPRYLLTNHQKLSSVVLGNATQINAYAFQSCNSLTSITLPKATLICSSAFINNTGIKNVQIGSTVSNALALTISAQAFSGCTNLSTISILHTSLATLQNSNAFTGTGITSTTGKIIVPASLYSSYQTRAQWSYFKNIMSTVTF